MGIFEAASVPRCLSVVLLMQVRAIVNYINTLEYIAVSEKTQDAPTLSRVYCDVHNRAKGFVNLPILVI